MNSFVPVEGRYPFRCALCLKFDNVSPPAMMELLDGTVFLTLVTRPSSSSSALLYHGLVSGVYSSGEAKVSLELIDDITGVLLNPDPRLPPSLT